MHCNKSVISVFLKLSSLSLYFRLRMARPFFTPCYWQMFILRFDSGFLTLFLYTGEIRCRLIVMILVTRSTTYGVEIKSLVLEVNAAA